MKEEGGELQGTWSVGADSTNAAVVVFGLWSDTGVYAFDTFSLNGNDLSNSGGVGDINGLPFWISVYNTDGSDSVLGDSEVYAVSRPILVTYQSCYDLLTGTKLSIPRSHSGLSLEYHLFGGDSMELTASAFNLSY